MVRQVCFGVLWKVTDVYAVLGCRYSSWGFLLLCAILAYVGDRNSFSMMHATCGGLVQGLYSVVGVSEWQTVVVGPEQR